MVDCVVFAADDFCSSHTTYVWGQFGGTFAYSHFRFELTLNGPNQILYSDQNEPASSGAEAGRRQGEEAEY